MVLKIKSPAVHQSQILKEHPHCGLCTPIGFRETAGEHRAEAHLPVLVMQPESVRSGDTYLL